MFDRRSPLASQLRAPGGDGLDGQRGLRLSEVGGWGLAQVGVFAGQEARLAAAVAPLLGAAALPTAPGQVYHTPSAALYRTAPDGFWVVTSQPKVILQLGSAVPASFGTVTCLSHSRVRLAVDGPQARAVLAKGISVDLHPRSFAVGAFAQTGLQHTGVLLERCAQDRYELYVLRTFAVSIWEWLLDAALPVGYQIAVEPAPLHRLSRAGEASGAETDT
jgi:methylglutamate dehydrogenase subunit D